MTLPCVGITTYFLSVLFLTDPVFVGSAYIEESQPIGNPVGDDDKIYFFFSEAGKEFDFFDNTIVSRIARVCKVRHLQSLHKTVMWTPEEQASLSVLKIVLNETMTLRTRQAGCSHVWACFFTVHHVCVDAIEMCHCCLRVKPNKHLLNRFNFSRSDISCLPCYVALLY